MLRRIEDMGDKEVLWSEESRLKDDQYVKVNQGKCGMLKFAFDVDGGVWDVMAFDFLDDLRVRRRDLGREKVSSNTEIVNSHCRVTRTGIGWRAWRVKVLWRVREGGVGEVLREGGGGEGGGKRSRRGE